jgi:hypothetical protein
VPPSATIEELRKAVGGFYYWRTEQIRESSGKPISEEMTLLMALVTFDGYELGAGKKLLPMPDPRTPDPMPDPQVESAIEFAKRLGTYNKLDRSNQYSGRYSNEILKHDIDLLFEKYRERDDRDFWHKCILAVIALVPSIIMFIMWFHG